MFSRLLVQQLEILYIDGETANASRASGVTIVTFSMGSDRVVKHQANRSLKYQLEVRRTREFGDWVRGAKEACVQSLLVKVRFKAWSEASCSCILGVFG